MLFKKHGACPKEERPEITTVLSLNLRNLVSCSFFFPKNGSKKKVLRVVYGLFYHIYIFEQIGTLIRTVLAYCRAKQWPKLPSDTYVAMKIHCIKFILPRALNSAKVLPRLQDLRYVLTHYHWQWQVLHQI